MTTDSTNLKPVASRRRKLLIGGAALTGLAMGSGLALWKYRLAEPQDEALVQLWALEAELPTGGIYKLSQLRGKPLVVNFWATWCPPCVEEMPLLDAFYRENAAKGWQIVGLAADNAKAANQFLSKMPISFPTPLAGLAGIELSRTLGNLSGALPFTVVLNSQGAIALRHMGKLSAQQIADFTKIA